MAFAALGLSALLAAGGLAAPELMTLFSAPRVTQEMLREAVQSAVAEGDGPGADPVCIANGLAYDQTSVRVRADNTGTVAWMNLLVDAGLYARAAPSTEAAPTRAVGMAEDAPRVAGDAAAAVPSPILAYRPLPLLRDWAGPRRLCVARGLRLLTVERLGRVQDVRFHGNAYIGVTADVIWTLDQPAPWLAVTGVGNAMAAALPAWRSERWTALDGQWRLVQRPRFLLVDGRWLTSDAVRRRFPTTLPPDADDGN